MAKNLIYAAMFRFIALYSMRFFLPIYYGSAFPDDFANFSKYNALFECFGGFTGSLLSGVISDRNNKNVANPFSRLVIASCLVSVPLQAVNFLTQDQFELSLGALCFQYLFSESYLPPYIAMLTNSVKPEQRGFIISVYIFMATGFGTVSIFFLDKLHAM